MAEPRLLSCPFCTAFSRRELEGATVEGLPGRNTQRNVLKQAQGSGCHRSLRPFCKGAESYQT